MLWEVNLLNTDPSDHSQMDLFQLFIYSAFIPRKNGLTLNCVGVFITYFSLILKVCFARLLTHSSFAL